MPAALSAVGLGANLGDAMTTIKRAACRLEETPGITIVAKSGIYRSGPMGPADQPDYVNAVVLAEVDMSALDLLDRLQAVERAFGRMRDGRHWGERTLDLDIITYGEERICSERLTVPHPGAHHRCFVLQPLAEIAPGLMIPGKGKAADLLPRCDVGKAEKISAPGETV